MSHDQPLTAALIEAFLLCPMKFRLYRLGSAEGGRTRTVDAAHALHAAVKHCLDECYRAGGPGAYPLERLLEEFVRSFEGRACADSREEEAERSTGLRLLGEYHADHRDDSVDDLRVDVALEGPIDGWDWRARAGRREARPDGSFAYLLYSTARQPPTALGEDLRTGVLQLLAEAAEGRPVEVEIHALRSRRVLDATKRPDQLAALAERLRETAAVATTLSDPPALRGRHCRWCHARAVCPAWSQR